MTTLYVLRVQLEENPLPDHLQSAALRTKLRDLSLDAAMVLSDISTGKRNPRKPVEA